MVPINCVISLIKAALAALIVLPSSTIASGGINGFPKGFNILHRQVFMKYILSICVLLTSCASTYQKMPMKLCGEFNDSVVSKEILNKALIEANRWAAEKYGKSCVTCAEIDLVESNSFSLHITSPAPNDVLINTSASMEFDIKTAKVLDKSVSHSCYVHYKN